MNPNFKKKKPLPYKNLGELYTEAVKGEPSINRLPIIETGSVLITRDNGAEDVLRQGVNDDALDKINVILNEVDLVEPIAKVIERLRLKGPDKESYLKLAHSLREAIKTSGSVEEIKEFCKAYSEGHEFIDIEKLTTPGDKPLNIKTLFNSLFAYKVFNHLFYNLSPGKADAGPGEAALVALSPNIFFANKGDVFIKEYKVEVKASRNPKGSGGRVWDKDIDQTSMFEALRSIFPDSQQSGSWIMSVVAATKKKGLVETIINNDTKKENIFIIAACRAWFGEIFKDVIDSFGTDKFINIWHKHIFNTYKKDKEFNGLLSIGINTYHYATTEDEFVQMKFYNNGSICNTESGQDRDLAPQLKIR